MKFAIQNIYSIIIMEKYSSLNIDTAAIKIMHKIRDKYLKEGSGLENICLLLQQKIIYSSIILIENNSCPEMQKFGDTVEIKQLIIDFAKKINKKVMENYERSDEQQSKTHQKFLNKSISLLMLSEINKYVKDTTLLKKLKILSFNNLSCLYKKKKKFGIALRAINFAVQLEQQLLRMEGNQQKYDIIPTYLNKAAIFSQMKKHIESLDIILKAKSHVQIIEKELMIQIQNTFEEKEKKRLLQKRYYGMYMKMIIFYNIAAEKEHMRLKIQALQFYKQSKQTAIIIDNQLMIAKLTPIIENLIQQNKK